MTRINFGKLVASATFCILASGLPTKAADDPQVDQLRTDVRSLEREVRELSKRIDQLQQAQGTAPAGPAVKRFSTATDPDPSAWMPPEKWNRVRTGMSAQDVILLLGAPVTMRPGSRPGSQTLYYTLPIGDGGFLTGTVRMQDDKVQEVEKPVLKQAGTPQR
jgi:hypothetical protein